MDGRERSGQSSVGVHDRGSRRIHVWAPRRGSRGETALVVALVPPVALIALTRYFSLSRVLYCRDGMAVLTKVFVHILRVHTSNIPNH